jgi:hypothetical protein
VATCEYFLGNLRVAAGAADNPQQLVTEGKWVTHGILFDSGAIASRASRMER